MEKQKKTTKTEICEQGFVPDVPGVLCCNIQDLGGLKSIRE